MSRRICTRWRIPMGRPSFIRHRPFSFSSTLQHNKNKNIHSNKVPSKQRLDQHPLHHGTTPKPTILRARIYGTLFLSIALLVTDESLDWVTRCNMGIKAVTDVNSPATYAEKKAEFMRTGAALLAAYSKTADALLGVHPPLAATAESQMGDQLHNWVLTAPDPEVAGGTLVLCQSVFVDDEEPDFYVSAHGSMNHDAAEALIPPFEDFARSLGGPVRGVMLLLQASGDWMCIYFDGKRWFNLLFLEWQTAESMGFGSWA